MPLGSDIIGHAGAIKALEEDLETGNVAHAYLFAGPAHVGKMSIAKRFAAELLLANVPAEERPERERRIARLLDPDLLVLDALWIAEQNEDWDVIARSSNMPQEHRSKGERVMRTDTIGIEDVRVLQERFYATGLGPRRVCVVRSVERMQDEAGNALLKILEEPPPGRVFILTTQALESLLPTIVSRSRLLHFPRLPESVLSPLLTETPPEERGFLLHLSRGAPGMLKTLLSDPDLLRLEKSAHADAMRVWNALHLAERMSALEPLWKRGPDAERFLLHLALTLHEAAPEKRAAWGTALLSLSAGLQTNAHRQLLTQRFALDISAALPSVATLR